MQAFQGCHTRRGETLRESARLAAEMDMLSELTKATQALAPSRKAGHPGPARGTRTLYVMLYPQEDAELLACRDIPLKYRI